MPIPTVFQGDCLEVMRLLPDSSISTVVTDPPYGLEFMGKDWDSPWKRGDDINADAGMTGTGYTDGGVRLPRPTFTGSTNPKCKVCRGTRRGRRDGTAKVAVCLCSDGGRFPNVRAAEVRAFQDWCEQWAAECLRVLKPGGHLLAFGGTRTWHRLACAIEDAGFEMRDSIAWLYGSGFPKSHNVSNSIRGGLDEPETPESARWQGWGTALKPAFEPVVVARKPLVGTVAQNVLAYGTGAINVDAGRIETTGNLNGGTYSGKTSASTTQGPGNGIGREYVAPAGRWPANVALDSDSAAELDQQSGHLAGRGNMTPTKRSPDANRTAYGAFSGGEGPVQNDAAGGGASRFFYVAKAPKSERPVVDGVSHPTVKPLSLMRWLVRMFTPPGGLVLDPFAGSGTTGEACMVEGFESVLIEKGAEYHPLIQARIDRQQAKAKTPEDAS